MPEPNLQGRVWLLRKTPDRPSLSLLFCSLHTSHCSPHSLFTPLTVHTLTVYIPHCSHCVHTLHCSTHCSHPSLFIPSLFTPLTVHTQCSHPSLFTPLTVYTPHFDTSHYSLSLFTPSLFTLFTPSLFTPLIAHSSLPQYSHPHCSHLHCSHSSHPHCSQPSFFTPLTVHSLHPTLHTLTVHTPCYSHPHLLIAAQQLLQVQRPLAPVLETRAVCGSRS